MATEDAALVLARDCAERMYRDDCASRDLGMAIAIPAPGQAEATMAVRADMVNGHDICHGGFVFTLADSAFAFACNAYNRVTIAGGANIDFLTPARLGERLIAVATEVHRGRRSGVYDVIVTTEEGRAVAVFRGRSVSLDEPVL